MFPPIPSLCAQRRSRLSGPRGRCSVQCLGMLALFAVLGAVGGACSSDDSDSSSADPAGLGATCTPGQSLGCVSTNGCDGYQVCNSRGDAYGSCVCSGASGVNAGGNGTVPSGSGGAANGGAATTAPSGGNLGGSTGSITAVGGVSFGQGGTSTTSTAALGGFGNMTSSCTPRSTLGDWTPPAYVPARSKQSACTDTEIRGYLDSCLKGTSCNAFESGGASESCGKCLKPSLVSDSAWGPLIEVAPAPFYRWETNPAGCIELQGYRACAAKLQAVTRCTEYACTTSDCGPMSAGYDQCTITARSSVCKPYFDASVCIPNQTVQQACYGGSDFSAAVLTVGREFCGATNPTP